MSPHLSGVMAFRKGADASEIEAGKVLDGNGVTCIVPNRGLSPQAGGSLFPSDHVFAAKTFSIAKSREDTGRLCLSLYLLL